MKAFLIAVLIAALPSSQAFAGMISTERVVADIAKERARIAALVQRKDVRAKLVEYGVSPQEADQRVASLSDAEVAKVSGQLDTLPAGGDGVYIGLGTLVLLVILVLLLTRR